jgi:hypothetical protein
VLTQRQRRKYQGQNENRFTTQEFSIMAQPHPLAVSHLPKGLRFAAVLPILRE